MFTKEHVHKIMAQSKIKERKKMNQKENLKLPKSKTYGKRTITILKIFTDLHSKRVNLKPGLNQLIYIIIYK